MTYGELRAMMVMLDLDSVNTLATRVLTMEELRAFGEYTYPAFFTDGYPGAKCKRFSDWKRARLRHMVKIINSRVEWDDT